MIVPPATTRTDITITHRDDGVVVSLRGVLDGAAAAALRRAVRAALDVTNGAAAVEVDLCEVGGWTTDGIHELVGCAGLGAGVRFRVGRLVESVTT